MYSKWGNAELVICRRHIFRAWMQKMESVTRHVHRISMQSWRFVHLQHLNAELVIYTRHIHGTWMQNWWLVQDIFTALECRIKDLYETYYLQDLNAELVTCTDKVKGRECRIDDWYKTLVLALSAYKFINMYILTTKIAYISTHTYTCIYVHACIYQGQQTEEKVFEKRKVFRRTDTGSMITETGSWFQEVEAWKEKEFWPLDLVWRGGILTKRAKLPGRSVKVKNVWMVGGGLIRDDLKAKQRQLVFNPLLNG